MDVSKAKIVIIVLLVAFNIFLLSNNLSHVRGQNTGDTISNTVTILKQRGISLECGIPRNRGGSRWLKYGSGKLDRASIAGKLMGDTDAIPNKDGIYEDNGKKLVFKGDKTFVFTDENPSGGFDPKNDDKLKKSLQELLKEKGLIDKNYIADRIERYKDGRVTVYFIEKYEGYLLFDNYCKVVLTANGIVELDYSRYQIIGFSGEKVSLPQAYQALLAYYKDGADKIITGIDYGYSLKNSTVDGMESIEVLPVWRAKMKDGSEPDLLDIDIATDKTVQ